MRVVDDCGGAVHETQSTSIGGSLSMGAWTREGHLNKSSFVQTIWTHHDQCNRSSVGGQIQPTLFNVLSAHCMDAFHDASTGPLVQPLRCLLEGRRQSGAYLSGSRTWDASGASSRDPGCRRPFLFKWSDLRGSHTEDKIFVSGFLWRSGLHQQGCRCVWGVRPSVSSFVWRMRHPGRAGQGCLRVAWCRGLVQRGTPLTVANSVRVGLRASGPQWAGARVGVFAVCGERASASRLVPPPFLLRTRAAALGPPSVVVEDSSASPDRDRIALPSYCLPRPHTHLSPSPPPLPPSTS